ncbi:mitochondrial pyruvate carrier [Chloropicon primus]|uniref:Mitochondrial pyruvate carrier n=1 Tax=Chloropicon primus TaxID=1764295 RepID=A0A5B8N1Y0_9CHLO|nr:mitochondrial pyruvate carrier [Chloropicon primus]UPR05060.1 mitochondrial pyruvate carrier [Chloropicon primus]|mmetsp:Transcript_4791/g.14289  ORF Transcript_4791/g.14289 Transcript_4791/m.14289 type:complete len:110 (+) Transcript_4791:169-498(+)|eukprot:QDZ25865.1 mitochondrial pyruvate carrier [Chloropicon primus]
MASVANQVKQFWNHPAGPKTIHFWAPTFKWGISAANIADFSSPVEKVSVPQQCAVGLTGMIWARFSTQIKPVNYNLMTVNFVMGLTAFYQLYRVASHHQAKEQQKSVDK